MKIVVFKILGLIIGTKISRAFGIGPLHSIACCVIAGHLLDLIASKKANEIRTQFLQKKYQAAFVKEHIIGTFFQILGKLCSADGKITEDEKNKARELAKVVFKLSKRECEQAIASMTKVTNFHLQSKAIKFFELYSNSPEMLNSCLRIAFEVAISDGKICAEEQKLLKDLSTFWSIEEKITEKYFSLYGCKQTAPSLNKSYEILGCSEKDTDQDIKKKYRNLILKYHPDKIQSKELPEEFVVFANQKFQSIQQAYEEIMNLRTTKVR